MLKRIKNLLVKLLVKKGLVYIDSADIAPVYTDMENTSGVRKKAGLVILAKNTCFETLRSFPFSSLKDIRQAVKSDIKEYCPFDTDLFFLRKINGTSGGNEPNETNEKTEVNLWFVKQNIAMAAQKLSPFLILPETYIFIFSRAKTPVFFKITKKDNKTLFVYVDEHTGVKSMESKSDADIKEKFSRICSKPVDDLDSITAAPADLNSLLKKGLFNIPFHEGIKFINKASYTFEFAGKSCLKYVYLSILLIFIYMGTSTFLIYKTKAMLEASDRLMGNKTESLMEKNRKLEKETDRLNLLRSMVEGYQPRTTLIQTIMQMAPEQTLIRKINISGNVLEIEGSAPHASVLIEELAKQKNMLDPRFTSPLTKDRKTGHERFNLIVENIMPRKKHDSKKHDSKKYDSKKYDSKKHDSKKHGSKKHDREKK